MHSKKTIPKKKNKLPAIVLAVVLLAAGGLFILERTNTTDLIKKPAINLPDGPTAEEKAQDAKINADNKQALIESEESTATNQSPTTTTPSSNPSGQKIDLSARQEGSESVTVFTKLYGYSSGKCTLTVTRGSKTNTQTADVMYQPEYSTCAGFSIPLSSVGSGTWNINLSVNSNGATTTKSISFEVN